MNTPRTNDEMFYACSFNDTEWVVGAEFAMSLERELNVANQAIVDFEEAKSIDKMLIGQLEDRVQALRDELDRTRPVARTGDFTEGFKKIAKEIDKAIGRH